MQTVSGFTNQNHLQIFKQLYFTKNNVIAMGISYICRKIFIQERTLYAYRQKYCQLILTVVDYISI